MGQLVRPLESVGCYVPGGRFPLVSTLLMTVIPAQVGGVKNIRVVSARPSEEVLAAAGMLGVKEFYQVGGAPWKSWFTMLRERLIDKQSKSEGSWTDSPGREYATAMAVLALQVPAGLLPIYQK